MGNEDFHPAAAETAFLAELIGDALAGEDPQYLAGVCDRAKALAQRGDFDSGSGERVEVLVALAEFARIGDTKPAYLALLSHLAGTPCRSRSRFIN